MNPKMSIITPSYNSARFIEETILSVKNQTYSPIEHIVMDGGSTDRTVDILRRYEGTYDLRWWSEPDRGQSHAYTKAIEMATGEWLLCLNSDDFLLDDMAIERMMQAIGNSPGFSIYMGHICGADERGNRRGQSDHSGFTVLDHDTLLNVYALCIHQATFVHRGVFAKVGLFSERFSYRMDYEFLLRATQFFTIRLVDVPVSALRIHATAKTQNPNLRSNIELIQARRMYGGSLFHRFSLYGFKGIVSLLLIPKPIKNFVRHTPLKSLLDKSALGRLGLGPQSEAQARQGLTVESAVPQDEGSLR